MELWSPQDEIPEGQYTVVVIAEGESASAKAASDRIERFSFEVTLVR
ncbi:MAG: hypothetical protein MK086_13815 [Flavobacteriales bacterium]|nr:hypothetical protein [Flavobacteriales bacterium]